MSSTILIPAIHYLGALLATTFLRHIYKYPDFFYSQYASNTLLRNTKMKLKVILGLRFKICFGKKIN